LATIFAGLVAPKRASRGPKVCGRLVVAGVFAAGDVTHVSEQVLVHIGEGTKAAVEAYTYLLELKSRGQ
jgi:alkyl hydroperoxide reductase subunit AhpF